MSLKDKLQVDLKDSLREKDTIRKDVIQIIRAGILQIEKDSKISADDSICLDIISKEIKKRLDVLPEYERSGREDSVKDINRQISILKDYLPQQLSENEISCIIDEAIKATSAAGMKDMGKVMAEISQKLKGRADNKLVADIVKAKLNNL